MAGIVGDGHAGSWFGLPDYGITERIGNMFGGGAQTNSGGSNLWGDQSKTTTYNTPSGQTVNAPGPKASTGPVPVKNNNVLGAQNTSGGGNNFDSVYNSKYQGWDRAAAEADYKATGGPGGGGEPQINLDEIYNPQFSALDEAQRALEAGRAEDEGYVTNQYNTNVGKVNRENEEQTGILNKDQETFQNSVKSALAEAVRYYNALQQQAKARFGGISSAGQAVMDLGQQEFLRNQGKINEQEIQGLNKFQQEKNRLGQYIKGKLDDLDLFKQDAMRQINQNFRNNLAQIASRRGELESQKAQAKIALLQDTAARVQAVKDADTQFRQGLAQFTLQQLANVSGRTFTPEEVADVINQFMNVNLGTGASGGRGVAQKKKGPMEDEFQTLMV